MTDDPQETARHYPEIVLFPDDPEARMEFVAIPPGTFWMGSRGQGSQEEPRHLVTIPAPRGEDGEEVLELPAFWMAKTPVTQAQFGRWTRTDAYKDWFEANKESFFEDDRSPHRNRFGPEPRLPAERLSWFEATAFCEWLGRQELTRLGLPRPANSRAPWQATPCLPSEAQWEYACRAGSATEYAGGDGVGALEAMGWFDENSDRRRHAVGELKPNAWDLYDMHGNVSEWCRDTWDDSPYRSNVDGDEARDPRSARGSAFRVVRGGSWFYTARGCRSAYRAGWLPGNRVDNQGLRVSLLPGPVAQKDERGALAPARAEAKARAEEGGGTPPDRAQAAAGADELANPLRHGPLPPPPR